MVNPHFFHWPSLTFYLFAGLFTAGSWIRCALFLDPAPTELEQLIIARTFVALTGTLTIVVMFRLARRVADEFKLRQPVYVAELKLDAFYDSMQSARTAIRFKPLPRFPAVERDFSLLLADGTRFEDVNQVIRGLNISEITSIEAIDVFQRETKRSIWKGTTTQIPEGKYSLLVRVTFQSRETTLTDAQIAEFSGRIIAALEKQLGAQLRAI